VPLVIYDARVAYILACLVMPGWLALAIAEHLSRRVIAHFAVCALLFASLNAFWIAPLLSFRDSTASEVLARAIFGNHFFTLRGALALFHPFWTGRLPAIFQLQPIPPQELGVALVAILALAVSPRRGLVLACAGVAIIGIFLGKQAAPPLSAAYAWLFDHFPGFSAFREASKFFVLIALGYAGLVALAVQAMQERWSSPRARRAGLAAVALAVVVPQLMHGWPLANGAIGGLFVERQFPAGYRALNAWIAGSDEGFRTLWVPTVSRWADFDATHPRLDAADAVDREWKRAFSTDEAQRPVPERLNQLLLERVDDFNRLLRVSAVRYVVVPLEDKANDDDFFPSFGARQPFVDALASDPELVRVRDSDGITVFEVRARRPVLYTLGPSSDAGIVPAPVGFRIAGDGRYELADLGEKGARVLVLAHSYDPSWTLCAGRDCIASRPYEENGVVLNKFILDEGTSLRGKPVSVAFAGQSGYRIGIAVSLAGLLAAIALVLGARRARP
jgi:hypothetical protein